MRLVSLIGILFAACSPALASGGLDCEGKGSKANFEVHGGVTRGMGGPLFDFSGELTIKDGAIAQDLRTIKFERTHVAQYWFDDKELKLGIYREREGNEAHGYVEVTVATKARGDEGEFAGNYELTVYDTAGNSEGKETRYKGKVSCFTE